MSSFFEGIGLVGKGVKMLMSSLESSIMIVDDVIELLNEKTVLLRESTLCHRCSFFLKGEA